MIRYERTKSSMFLMEILINILLFSLLCVCSLQFFIKALNLTENTTTLHHAVTACNNVAAIYETGEGNIEDIWNLYSYALHVDGQVMIYFDENYEECSREESIYYVFIKSGNSEIPSIDISFHHQDGTTYYQIRAFHYQPLTPSAINTVEESEVSANE